MDKKGFLYKKSNVLLQILVLLVLLQFPLMGAALGAVPQKMNYRGTLLTQPERQLTALLT